LNFQLCFPLFLPQEYIPCFREFLSPCYKPPSFYSSSSIFSHKKRQQSFLSEFKQDVSFSFDRIPPKPVFFFFLKILSPLSEVTFSLFPANQILFQYDRLSLSSYTIPCRIDVKTQEKTLTTSALSPQKDLVNLELP
jgi:hypothetical protein